MLSLPRGERLEEFGRRLRATWVKVLSPRCEERVWAKSRDALAIGLGLCGLRWEEVHRATWSDVVGGPEYALRVHTAKGGRQRSVCVGASWWNAAIVIGQRWRDVNAPRRRDLLDNAPAGRIFVTRRGRALRREHVGRRLGDWTERVFGRRFSFHCLRHTFACRLYEETRDVLAVQRALGHVNLKWTATYLRSLEVIDVPNVRPWDDKPVLKVFGSFERRA